MTENLKQSEINDAAWAACDTFRGVLDPAQYKDYILVTLFLKYISDVWQDHYNSYRERYNNDDERIRRKLERERFILPLVEMRDSRGNVIDKFVATFNELYSRRERTNIGELINVTLEHIEEANKTKLEGVFRNVDFNSEPNLGKPKDRNRRLKLLLEDFHKPELDMSPSRVSEDVIGNTYMYLLSKFGSGKKAGEYYTPAQVSELLAKLARPQRGDTICDPACGSGGLLIAVAHEVHDRDFALFGMEVNGSTWAMARMNMFLHNMDSARIEWCNALTSPALVEHDKLMKFNIVVANPPFSLDKWGADEVEEDRYSRFWRGLPPKGRGDYAFISHMVEAAIEKEGRVAVVVPHGVLFRGGTEGRIRQKFIEDNILDAVIGLPVNLFPSTSIPVAIMVFDRSREKGGHRSDCKDVLFVDASKRYQPGKNQNVLLYENVNEIVEAFIQRRPVDKYSHLATLEEIAANDFNLNIPRYVDTFEAEVGPNIDDITKDIELIENELVEVRSKIQQKLKEIH